MRMRVGIDVSHWNGEINWDVVTSFIDFALLKCGGWETKEYSDTAFEHNFSAIKERVAIGTYYYAGAALLTKGGRALGEHCLDLLRGKKFKYPVYIDIEDKGFLFKQTEVTEEINEFISTVEPVYEVGVYGSEISTFKSMVHLDELKTSNIWVANYNNLPSSLVWDIWQYTGKGSIPGIKGPVDINIQDRTEPDYQLTATQVLNGLWGNGTERKNMLKKFGFQFDKIQAYVNEILANRHYVDTDGTHE